jgi:4-amino-4-deoxy-L-arabinose transferase-like glycosyltransferase
VATLAEDWGLALLTVAKFATVLFVAATFLIVGRTRPRLASAVLAFGIFIGGMGALSNIATL